MKKLHEEYGPVVRIGPNLIDLDYPELIKTIYSTDEAWRKVSDSHHGSVCARSLTCIQTEFYHNNSIMSNGQVVYNVFSITDPAEHARMQRPIAKHFSVGSVLALEPLTDKSIQYLCNALESRFTSSGSKKGARCDLGEWIAYCEEPPFLKRYRSPLSLEYKWLICEILGAWDVITSITFSHPYGYMEKGYDFDNTIANLDKTID